MKDHIKINIRRIMIFLLILIQIFISDINKVEAYPYDAGYDYYQYPRLIDNTGKTHYFTIITEGRYGNEHYLKTSIYNEDGTLYNEKRYDYAPLPPLGQDYARPLAVVPNNDLSKVRVYFGVSSATNPAYNTDALVYMDFIWSDWRYIPAPVDPNEHYWSRQIFGKMGHEWTHSDVYHKLGVTPNGIVYVQRTGWNNDVFGDWIHIKGRITQAGYQNINWTTDKWYGYRHFSTNGQYAYERIDKNQYRRINRSGVAEIIEGDMYLDLYKANILDLEYYEKTGNPIYFNSKHNLVGKIRDMYFNWNSSGNSYIPKNVSPENLKITNPLSNSIYTKEGTSTINIVGSVRDPDNDTLTVTAELAGVTKSTTLTNTSVSSGAAFNFTFDVAIDDIPEGTHTIKVSVTDGKIRIPITATRNIQVQARVKHNGFVLVNSPLYYKLVYQDEESDPKHQEQFRYVHDPNYFKNSLGVIPDSNTWRNTVYNNLSLPGHYKVTSKAKDNPKNISTFDEYKMWSNESLSEINLYVHRKPVAVFKASINNLGNLTITDVDKSYDLDHQGETNNGIIARQWRWRKVEDVTWTTSNNPPTSFPPGQEYILGLRVRDKDGENGVGVWSDYTDITIGTGTLAPLNALFTLNPSVVSHNPSKTITVANLSSGAITRYEWIIRKAGVQQGSIISTAVPTSAQLKAYGIGQYTLQLRVGDASRWSEPYTLPYEVINNPPIAKFEAPDVVYRDTNISLINKTAADLDGDTITYLWKLKQPSGAEYNISTAHSPTFKIQSFLNSYAINPVTAISKNWEIKLIATDAKGAKSEFTKDLEVINNVPEAKINGPISVNQYTTHNYTSSDTDADTGDNPLAIFIWKHIRSDGSHETYTSKDITVTFNEYGEHTIEHYVIDKIGDKSNIATLNVEVEENQAPKMVITSPSGTPGKPTVIPGDPLMKWTYSDPENDLQEKYSFDFYYADDDILVKSPTNDDSTGNIREYQVPQNTFERFRTIKAVGRSFSKFKWSELSNEVYFIINDAPTGGFNLNKNPANYVRNEEIKITGFGDDPNIESGDSINYKYYLKKLPSGSETLISSDKDFTHIINSLTSAQSKDTYQIRQVITDSLGFTAPEVIKIFTINNQKPIVEIIEPSSSNSNDPTLISEVDLKPTIRWDYTDLDGDNQKKYKVTIYNGLTNNIVVSSGEITSANKYWTVSSPLVEDKLYSVIVEVYDGHEWSISERKYFKVFSLKISGHLLPNPAMAGDKIYFYITTEGYADKIEIVVPSDLIAMDNRVSMGYPAVTYPSMFFNVDKNIMKKEDILEYIVWVSTEDTLGKNNVRLRQPYKFIVRAYKGTVTREIELELDVRGSIFELLKPGIKNKNGK